MDELTRLWEVEEKLNEFCKENNINLSGSDNGKLLIESSKDPGLITYSEPITSY